MSLTYKAESLKDQYYDFAMLNNWRYAVDGVSRPEAYNGTTTRNMSIRMNGDDPTDLTETAAGSLTLLATYKYKYTYYNATDNVESNPSGSAEITLTGANDGVTLDIPANASIDTQVTHVRIYRTNANGNIYYYNQQVAYTGALINDQADNLADTGLGSPYGKLDLTGIVQTPTHGIAPTAKFIVSWNNRIWLSGFKPYDVGTVSVTNGNATVTGDGTAWTSSMKGWTITIGNDAKSYIIDSVASTTSLTLTEDYDGSTASEKSYEIIGDRGYVFFSHIDSDGNIRPEYFPASNYLNINPNDGDEESGFIPIGSRLLAFKRRGIYYISGNDETNYTAYKMNTPVGCVSFRSLVHDSVGNVLFMSEQGVHLTDGQTFKTISNKIKNIWSGEGTPPFTINKDRFSDCHAVFNKWTNRLWLWVTSSDANRTNKVLVGDFNVMDENMQPEWFIFDIDANASTVFTDKSGRSIIYFGDEDGFVYKVGEYTNDGAGSVYTRRGTVTAATSNTLTDSTATFNIGGDGYKSLYISILTGTGAGQKRKVSSNTGTQLTLTQNWDTTPDTTSVYAIGAIDAYWKSKPFHWEELRYKIIKWIKILFNQTSTSYNLNVQRLSDRTITDEDLDTSYYGGSETQTVDLSDEVTDYKKIFYAPNKAIKHQFKFGINDVDKPFTIKEVEIAVNDRGRR